MPVVGLVGLQWGDEGKGKVVDIVAAESDLVARYQGGPNAGHTVVIGDKQIILHTVPTGILQENVKCLIGNGVVIDPAGLVKEITDLEALGYPVRKNLVISVNAHLIMPYHKLLDKVQEQLRGAGKIGTTGRGIGCAYADKALRQGIRVIDLFDKDKFIAKTKLSVNFYNLFFRNIAGLTPLKEEEVIEQVWQYAKTITALAVDGTEFINDYIRLGKKVLAEGAQGVHLDIDFGTYPYVTSSNPSPGGICTGLGISPRAITRLIGVVKAYTTRVGEGPLPTELTEEAGETLRRLGGEYGATTGRPRRCGWLDIPLLRRSLQLTGIREIALTKLDVLDTFPLIKVCKAYKYNATEVDILPYGVERNDDVKPIYEVLPGWEEPTQDITEYDKLPENARRYLEYIERLLKVQVILISVGPQRRRAIIREHNIWQE